METINESAPPVTLPHDKKMYNYVARLQEVKNIHSQILRLRKLAVEAEKLRRDKDESLAALLSIRELNKKTIQKTNSLVARSKQEVEAMRTRLHQTVSYTRRVRARCRGKVETLSQINERLATELKRLQGEVANKDNLIEKLKSDHERAKADLAEIRGDHERDAEALQILQLKYKRLERKVRGLAMSVSGSTGGTPPPPDPENSPPEVVVKSAQRDGSMQNIDTRKSSSSKVRFEERDAEESPPRREVDISIIKPASPWDDRQDFSRDDLLLDSDNSVCRCSESNGPGTEETKISQIKDFVLNRRGRSKSKSKSSCKSSTTVVSSKRVISEGKTFTLTREEIQALAPEVDDLNAAERAPSAESGDCLLARIKSLSQDSLMEAQSSSRKSATNCAGVSWIATLRRKLSCDPE